MLETMAPDPAWDAESRADVVDALGAKPYTFRVWAGDWCPDCRGQLPAFAAALEAAGVPDERVVEYAVEREDGEKVGEGMDAYGVEYIPTVVVELDGEEVARFVEEERQPIATHLAERLRDAGATA
jgi:thiol-disulfide isomerase/thioredoxin